MQLSGLGLVGGLGAYPDDPYYDPDRPSWFPNWLNTPTEAGRKWQLMNLPAELVAQTAYGIAPGAALLNNDGVANAVGAVAGEATNWLGDTVGNVAENTADKFFEHVNLSGILLLAAGVYLAVTVLPGVLAARH